MCGFLGEFFFDDAKLLSKDQFKNLLSVSKHRGPDASCIRRGETFQLGFNRLAILDLSLNGTQPMQSPSKRYQLVFNGEIYNYKELIAEYGLENFKSSTDTEVITQLLDLLGVGETIEKLNGMFAIGVIDLELNELYLTRDFAGVKPLFYGLSEGGVVFASQFNQVFKHPLFQTALKLRPEIVKEYFGLGYMQAPNTIYSSIFQLNPGEILKVFSNGSIEKQPLNTFSTALKNSFSFEEKEGKVYDTILKDVIQRQLVSDVPLATFLSGGIDSPLVTAIAKDQQPTITAFTLGVSSKKHDESGKATEYANHIKVAHAIEGVEEQDLLKAVDGHFKCMSEPFGDYSSIPIYVITKRARKKHTVMLSGDGGDELFLGYPRMLDVFKKRYWFLIPHKFRKPLVRVAIKLKLFRSWGPYSYNKIEDWVLGKHLHITPKKLESIIPNTNFSKELNKLYEFPNNLGKKSLLHWLRWNEFYGHLQRVLIKVDRMSMANSMEVRVPFLDKKSISFAWQYTPKFESGGFELKELLKNVLGLYYPKELIENEKKGFSVPIEEWLRNELKSDLKKMVMDTPIYGEGIVSVKETKKYVLAFLNSDHEDSWGVWHVYAWQKWARSEDLI